MKKILNFLSNVAWLENIFDTIIIGNLSLYFKEILIFLRYEYSSDLENCPEVHFILSTEKLRRYTAQKMKFSIKDFFS